MERDRARSHIIGVNFCATGRRQKSPGAVLARLEIVVIARLGPQSSLRSIVQFPPAFFLLFLPNNNTSQISTRLISFVCCRKSTYNQEECDDIPRSVNNVRLPRDVLQRNGHDKGEKQAEANYISF